MKTSKLTLIVVLGLMVNLLYACANTNSVARVHPEAVQGLTDCGQCHTDRWANLNHKAPDFLFKHGVLAGSRAACATCHQESFCADCHAHKDDLKPSDKYKESPERALPHRGDYLSRHRIDGMIDPSSCLKCHGRQNNEGCKRCHR